MAGDEETGVSIMRLDAGARRRARLPRRSASRSGPTTTTARSSARLERLSGELLVRALDERPAVRRAGRGRASPTPTRSRRATARWTSRCRPRRSSASGARAAPAHRRAAAAARTASSSASSPRAVDGETLAPAGGRVRVDDGRLLLDCNGGALELTEIRPPGGRPMAAADWLRGRPDPAHGASSSTRRCPAARSTSCSSSPREWTSDAEWAPYLSALAYRGDEEVLLRARDGRAATTRSRAASPRSCSASSARPCARFPARVAAALEVDGAREEDPDVLAAIAHGFGHLGEPYGLDTLLRLAATPTRASARRRRSRSPAAAARARSTR